MVEIVPLLISFLIAYIGVSTLGFGLYLVISKVRGTSPWDEVEIRENKSYQLTNRWLPLLNLVIWTLAAWYYFSNVDPSWANIYALAAIWLAAVVVIDYVAFVLIKHPLSADHRGFYLGQGIWIYLTYLAVFTAPIICGLLLV